jgi:hypothetical protein
MFKGTTLKVTTAGWVASSLVIAFAVVPSNNRVEKSADSVTVFILPISSKKMEKSLVLKNSCFLGPKKFFRIKILP